ncbi:MAG: hypothetical protein JW781_06260 [Deltaproteobacteria bacterium]|nr:hypothetical protein [Candidatus Anaeroferrophillacea bacterium]
MSVIPQHPQHHPATTTENPAAVRRTAVLVLLFLLLAAGPPGPAADAEVTAGGIPFLGERYDLEISGTIDIDPGAGMLSVRGTYRNRYWEPVANVTHYWQVLATAGNRTPDSTGKSAGAKSTGTPGREKLSAGTVRRYYVGHMDCDEASDFRLTLPWQPGSRVLKLGIIYEIIAPAERGSAQTTADFSFPLPAPTTPSVGAD